jgi:hypothetical protein
MSDDAPTDEPGWRARLPFQAAAVTNRLIETLGPLASAVAAQTAPPAAAPAPYVEPRTPSEELRDALEQLAKARADAAAQRLLRAEGARLHALRRVSVRCWATAGVATAIAVLLVVAAVYSGLREDLVLGDAWAVPTMLGGLAAVVLLFAGWTAWLPVRAVRRISQRRVDRFARPAALSEEWFAAAEAVRRPREYRRLFVTPAKG